MLTRRQLDQVAKFDQTYPRRPGPCFGAPPDPMAEARWRADQDNAASRPSEPVKGEEVEKKPDAK